MSWKEVSVVAEELEVVEKAKMGEKEMKEAMEMT